MNFNFAIGCVIALSFVVFGIGLYLIHLKKKLDRINGTTLRENFFIHCSRRKAALPFKGLGFSEKF